MVSLRKPSASPPMMYEMERPQDALSVVCSVGSCCEQMMTRGEVYESRCLAVLQSRKTPRRLCRRVAGWGVQAGDKREASSPQVAIQRNLPSNEAGMMGCFSGAQGRERFGVNCLAYDEAIMAQQDRIQQEIAVQNPLVSERMELTVLYKEYADDDHVYQQKIKDLLKKYSYIRKTRPDGNCFYRAFGFSHLEALLEDGKELQRFKEVAAQSKDVLVSQGFTEFTIEDFHNTFMDLIEQVEKQTTVPELLASFNDQSTSDYLVVYLRLLTSGYLQRESKFFEHFIEGGRNIKEFCQQEVEPMCKESDHIHIIALAQALHVSILVEYMDRGEGGATNPHIFPEGSEPKVYLLYRPGHYDILYK
ncbi:ubiquitin thioesterase OTUB1 isoform X2 [Hemicordylus capensis]|uniref:ubiquitin thioesterase OTUB1 isoform X2 n=1 Tax=Hemicordylus capensis TaxID=884348 RepID=UPI002303E6FC|nr:ubiquitin thioesterase OTUB1 isoform X2 [Hemicordylus capensis]